MNSALWAEWIITRLTDRTRAASIVGDLLETAPQRGSLWFWLSVAGVVLSLTWRRPIAFAAAFYAGLFWRRFMILIFFPAGHPLPHINHWDWFGTLLWIAATYAAIRYGLRDKFAQLALRLSGLITMVYWWMPIVTLTCIALACFILVASVRSAQGTRALMALAAALAFGFGGILLSIQLETVTQNLLYLPMTRYVGVCFEVLAAWIMTTACSLMHHLLLRPDQRSMEIESL